MHPQDVARTVTVKWFMRWQLYEKAKSARHAQERAADIADLTKLSSSDLKLIDWTERDD